jgi:hypothetical protein
MIFASGNRFDEASRATLIYVKNHVASFTGRKNAIDCSCPVGFNTLLTIGAYYRIVKNRLKSRVAGVLNER